MTADPFAHHPELRDKIEDPMQSYFRSFQPALFDETMRALGYDESWRYSDAEREARRRSFLGPRLGRDLWVFAYGSLMWNPGFRFAEVRMARALGYSRRFCLLDTFNWRGTREMPGLMAALDRGSECQGLVYRIAADLSDEESEVVWRRECLAPAYVPAFISVDTAQGPVEALSFLANHDAPEIVADLSHDDQVRMVATGKGDHGTSMDYLEGIAAQFAVLGIDDPEVVRLLTDARAWR